MSDYQPIRKRNIEDNIWLHVGDVNKLELENPLEDFDSDFPGLAEMRTMRNTDHLMYAAEVLLNIENLPEQGVVLEELWKRAFPMFIASRGYGKATTMDTPILLSGGWTRMGDAKVGDRIYGRDGKLHNIVGVHPQGQKQVCRLTLLDGRSIDCCEDHLWVVRRTDGKECVVTTKKIICEGASYLDGSTYKFRIPNVEAIERDKLELPLDPYILGCLLGDGCLTTLTPKIASDDTFIIDQFRERLPGFELQKDTTNNNYTIVDRNKDHTDHISSRGTIYQSRTNNRLTSILKNMGLNVGCKDKFIPETYKLSSIADRMELVRGLIDTDGCVCISGAIEFTNTCERLVDDLIDVLRSLGITCIKDIDNRAGQMMVMPQNTLFARRPYFRVYINTSKPIAKLPRKLERIKLKATSSEKYVSIVKAERLSTFAEMQCISVDNPDYTYVTKDYLVTHNSFLMAEYATLRCALVPGTKIVIVGAAFRQSKVIFDYMVDIWKNSPILRSICDANSGPTSSPDRCLMRINDSWTMAVPLGDGSKIRGLRAHTIIADEFACLKKDSIVETDNGFVRIQDFDSTHYVVTGNDKIRLEKPNKFIVTPYTDVYEIKLRNGYVIRCSENHKVNTNNGWKKPLQLTNLDYIEQSSASCAYFGGGVAGLDHKMAWLLGTLVSEGCITHESQISVTTTDVNTCMRLVNEYGFKFNVVDAYIDHRDWVCKTAYKLWKYDRELRSKLFEYGLDFVTAHDKKIPHAILRSPEDVVQHFLSGLFDGDGSCFLWQDREVENRIGLAYYSVSERLCRDVQFLMYKLGFDGYLNQRESKISDNPQWFVRWNDEQARVAATYLMIDRFNNTISQAMITPEPSNYCWDNDRKRWKVSIVYCGKTIQKRFRNENDAKDFVDQIRNRPKYRQVVGVTKLNDLEQLYDYYLPQTHSFYADGHRQHNSIPPDVFETVVRGFTAVSAKPIDNVKAAARRKYLQEEGKWSKGSETSYAGRRTNQVIITGTADYDFKHYADYHRRYCKIIRSQGDEEKLRDVFGQEDIPEHFDWRDYSVIRIPYELIPEGFMDDKQVAQAKATVHSGIYQMEYGACFTSDSDGFFRRSLIESCVTNKAVKLPSGEIQFDAMVEGNSGHEYVFGVDPASERDNFSIIILEKREDHNRIVYSWTTTRHDFVERKRAGIAVEGDFYGFCARKIRDLMKTFPTKHIAIDAQGGGIAVMEALHDPAKLHPGEALLWPVIDPEKEQMTDSEAGEHVLHMIQFANAEWTAQANHGLRKDLEDRVLLFPRYDGISTAMATDYDQRMAKSEKASMYDSMEDNIIEIEDLKNELCTIVLTRTGTGVNSRDRWDTPEIVMPNGRKGRLRKDRYSSLVMANMVARSLQRESSPVRFRAIGGFAKDLAGKLNPETARKSIYAGAPAWLRDGVGSKGLPIRAIRRKYHG